MFFPGRIRCVIPKVTSFTKLGCTSSMFVCFNARHNSSHHNCPKNASFDSLKFLAITFVSSGLALYKLREVQAKSLTENKSLPTFKASDVAKHSNKENGVWVTYDGGVYDITEFIDKHPGGKKVLLAAGGSVEPYWAIYGVHNNNEVKAILEEYKIGVLDSDDVLQQKKSVTADHFSNDPKRHPALIPASLKPYNAEPPAELLVDSFNTPNEIFYVRNHMPVPEIDKTSYRLEIVGINKKVHLSLDDIRRLPKYSINATVMCAGNRRSEMSQVKPVKGLTWKQAAVGNAEWSGARLVDVLQHCGISATEAIRHVHFEGLDSGPDGVAYAASVPAEAALDPGHDVLLAYEMNGEPLPRDHGAPLRVIVPGVVGARNVKWLSRVVLSEQESDSHWQQSDYKGLPPGMDWDTIDFSIAPAIQELPVTSAFCVPVDGDTVELIDGCVNVQGYAWSGGGRQVVRVDVSSDQGRTWHVAELNQGSESTSRHWSWTLWSLLLPVSQNKNEQVELWVKAVDSSYNSQPEKFEHIWNLRGVLSNAYHRVKVMIS